MFLKNIRLFLSNTDRALNKKCAYIIHNVWIFYHLVEYLLFSSKSCVFQYFAVQITTNHTSVMTYNKAAGNYICHSTEPL
jgi:hypothetical protein